MDSLYDEGIRFILYLQKSWSSWDNEMLFLSKFGDPRNNFLIYFPIFYHWSAELGVSVLWTAVISEWLNLVLKWMLQGERPYWWVHESIKWRNVTLKQYQLTCETGPGSPSGHAMVTSAVFCLVVLWFTQLLKEKVQHQLRPNSSLLLNVTAWSVLFVILSLVSLSRVFIATHFPHQVLLGTIIGLIVATVVKHYKSLLIRISHSAVFCVFFSLSVIGATLFTYLVLAALVYNPSTSVAKAKKWCVKSSYVHLDTTPFYALVRDCGVTAGIGISQSLFSLLTKKIKKSLRDSKIRVQTPLYLQTLKFILSILLLQLLKIIPLPNSNSLLFYMAGYVRCSFIPIVVIFIIPSILTSWEP